MGILGFEEGKTKRVTLILPRIRPNSRPNARWHEAKASVGLRIRAGSRQDKPRASERQVTLDDIKNKTMGTWGTSIFSDDFAADIRGEFRDKIGNGKSPELATSELISDYAEDLSDPDEACIFWLALAAAQWKLGRLQDFVKQKALGVIDAGTAADRWADNVKAYQKRQVVLAKLKSQLLGDQPAPKKIAKPFICETKMEAGDLLSYRCSDGNIAILRVIDVKQDHCGDRYPKIEILDHFNTSMPEINAIKKLRRKIIDNGELNDPWEPSGFFYIAPYGKRDPEPWDKLNLLEKGKVKEEIAFNKGTVKLFWWRDFENHLNDLFNNK